MLRDIEGGPQFEAPTTQTVELKNEPAPREDEETKKINEAINEITNIPEDVRTVIKKWSRDLFGLKDVRNRGYQEYLNSDNSLHQIFGAAALLAEKVDVAKAEDRDLTPEEIKDVENAFLKAANSRRKEKYRSHEGDEIEELSKNIDTLAEIVRRLK